MDRPLPRAVFTTPAIKIKVKLQHVDGRFAEKTELASFAVRGNNLTHLVFAHAALTRHARYLKLRGGRRDVRVEARTGRRHQINRNGLAGILGMKFFHIALYAVNQFLIGRAKV